MQEGCPGPVAVGVSSSPAPSFGGSGSVGADVVGQLFLGENLLAWIILALGGALACGNAMALLRPPPEAREGDLPRAPVGRSLFMGALGLVAAIWALATLSR